jgi:hypothetical protein
VSHSFQMMGFCFAPSKADLVIEKTIVDTPSSAIFINCTSCRRAFCTCCRACRPVSLSNRACDPYPWAAEAKAMRGGSASGDLSQVSCEAILILLGEKEGAERVQAHQVTVPRFISSFPRESLWHLLLRMSSSGGCAT